MDTLSQSQRQLMAGVAGLLLGIVLTSLGFSLLDRMSVTDEVPLVVEEKDTTVVEPMVPREVSKGNIDRVDVADQHAASFVILSGVTLAAPSWVAVHESLDGQPGNILGATIFNAGASRGKLELLRATSPGQRYYVRLYRDNGDREFDLQTDPLVVGENKEAIQDVFTTNTATEL